MFAFPLIWWRWLARAGFVSAVLVICLLAFSSDPPELATRMSDKLNHTLAFFVLAILLDQTTDRLSPVGGLLLPLLGYGFFIELVQGQLGYREMSWLDIGADTIGILFYIVLRAHIKSGIVRVIQLH